MADGLLRRLGIEDRNPGVFAGSWIEAPGREELASINPATGRPLARVALATVADYDRAAETARAAFGTWRSMPAPLRGEVVRRIGLALREQKRDLGLLVTLETGKIRSEGEGEVQEMIDMCDFAVGLSRQLHGLTIASERPGPPDVRAVAPARAGGDHHRVQLPGRRLGLERLPSRRSAATRWSGSPRPRPR